MSIGVSSITREGYERLEAELEELIGLRHAAAAAALEDPELLEHRIADLRRRLAEARIVEPARDGTIGVGAFVRLRTGSGRTIDYQLVGAAECDAARGRVSVESPVGEALLGRAAGDAVEAETPSGRRRFEILAVDYLEERAAA